MERKTDAEIWTESEREGCVEATVECAISTFLFDGSDCATVVSLSKCIAGRWLEATFLNESTIHTVYTKK